MNKYLELREQYNTFIYDNYDIEETSTSFFVTYHYIIPNLENFTHKLEFQKIKELDEISKKIIFEIGIIEAINYWKATCGKKFIINSGHINENQIKWFKKLYYNGLQELLFKNNIEIPVEDFIDITTTKKESIEININYQGTGNLIPVGGGKDSCVTLELLKNQPNNSCFMVNPKNPMLNCAKIAEFNNTDIYIVKRELEKDKLIKLNNQGFINGHIPISSLYAFVSLFGAYQLNKKFIVLSNEDSANESTVKGTNVNHQYSKSYEFEKDFNNYIKENYKINITYFSLLRPLSEYQIAMLFSKYEEYHKAFISCNLGSKNTEWTWCNDCAKCLFIFIILSPFLYKEKLINIFNQDLFENQNLLQIFKDLIGDSKTKPFECVGTIQETRYALTKTITKLNNNKEKLPYLLDYYFNNYELSNLSLNLKNNYNNVNNLTNDFATIIKKELDKYDK